MENKKIPFVVLVACAVLIAACGPIESRIESRNQPRRSASTTVTQDPAYSGGSFQSVLVVLVLKDQTLRRQFEDSIRERLVENGVDAVAAHTFFPTADEMTQENVRAYLAEAAIEGVLVTRIVGMETETFETAREVGPAPTAIPWNEFRSQNLWVESSAYSQPRGAPGYAIEENVIAIEISLFQADDGARIWQADRKATLTGDRGQIISETGQMIIEELQAGNLI